MSIIAPLKMFTNVYFSNYNNYFLTHVCWKWKVMVSDGESESDGWWKGSEWIRGLGLTHWIANNPEWLKPKDIWLQMCLYHFIRDRHHLCFLNEFGMITNTEILGNPGNWYSSSRKFSSNSTFQISFIIEKQGSSWKT